MIVVGDEYLPSSLVDYSGSDSNLDFAVSVMEWLSGSDRLLALKGRASPDTRIDADAENSDSSTARSLSKSRIVNLIFIPGCCALFMVLAIVRRKTRQ